MVLSFLLTWFPYGFVGDRLTVLFLLPDFSFFVLLLIFLALIVFLIATFLSLFPAWRKVAFAALLAFIAPFLTVLVVSGAALGTCLAVSLAAFIVSVAALTVSSTALAVPTVTWLFLISLAVSLISFAVSFVATAASCTASASSVIAPLSWIVFTVFLAAEDVSRMIFATSLTFFATSSGLIFSSRPLRLRFFDDDDIQVTHINKDMLKKINWMNPYTNIW